MDDDAFLAEVGRQLGALPTVEGVTLGGSRADGTHRPNSDWDFSIYYRGAFSPQSLRDLGWSGEVFEIGGWTSVNGGVFNGGAWLEIGGRRSDVHYRDLDVVDRVAAEAGEGRFDIEPLWFHLAGIPTYLVLAELATRRVLFGTVPRFDYPARLRELAPERWWAQAEAEFDYAERYHAAAGRTAACLGLVARALVCAAHAIVAARGEWVTNDKQLLARAGLAELDDLLGAAGTSPEHLRRTVAAARARSAAALSEALDAAG